MKFLLALLTLSLGSCSKPKPPAKEVPTYQTFHREKFNGSFFHFDHDGDLYLGCSIHQGGSAPKTVLTRNGSSETVTIAKQVHAQKDLRILTFQSDSVTRSDALPYLPDPEVRKGDAVVILNRGQKIGGTVVQGPTSSDHRYYLQTAKTFAAAGMSGSPVFSKRLGTVVGILQTANNKTAANIGGFELLQMP